MAELRVKSTGTLKLFENDNTSNVTIASPASLGADRTVTLPDANVTLASGTMLATDGDGSSLTGLTAGQIPNLGASKITSGTMATARLGSGTASSSTVLYGDQTYKAEPSSVFGTNSWWSSTSGETRTNNVNKIFAMDTQIYDPDDVFDPSAAEYKFTAPVTGTYMFFVDIYQTDGSGMDETVTVLYKNGVYISNTRYAWAITDMKYYSGGWSYLCSLDADDYVQLFGSNSAADAGDQLTENRGTFFGGWRVA